MRLAQLSPQRVGAALMQPLVRVYEVLPSGIGAPVHTGVTPPQLAPQAP